MLTWIRRLLDRRRDEQGERPVTEGQRAASAALDRAENARARMQAQRREVEAEAGSWRLRRERNHFAELVRDVVLGGESR